MTDSRYIYEADWRDYAFEPKEVNFASDDEIKDRFKCIELTQKNVDGSGITILTEGNTSYVNDKTEMAMIFGGTGSKKTRAVIAPLICTLAKSRESMIILDVKGELSTGALAPYVRGSLSDAGYKQVFIDFRDMNADSINIMEPAYEMYQSGDKDGAMREIANIAALIGENSRGKSSDPYWDNTASLLFVSLCALLLKVGARKDQFNMLTIASYMNERVVDKLAGLLSQYESTDVNIVNLKTIVGLPDKTRMCVLSTLSSMMEPFINNNKLLNMLSNSSFTIEELYERHTAIFIIVPDEVSTYDMAAGLIIKQIDSKLVSDAYEMNGKLPRRVNFICDEFCNYKIRDAARSVSSDRSRNIRWFYVCQSLGQLEKAYPDDYEVILANCADLFYLNSSEMRLLEYLSKRSGVRTDNLQGESRPLITVQQLQSLKKTDAYAEAYYVSKGINFVTKLLDISAYECYKKHESRKFMLMKRKQGKANVMVIEELCKYFKKRFG